MSIKRVLILAWRNIWRNKRRSLITMSSVLFAVLLAIFFYSLEKGTYDRMIDNMVRFSTGYIQIQDVLYDDEPSMDHSMLVDDHITGLLDEYDDMIDVYVPRIQHFALAASGPVTRGSMVMGIDPGKEARLNDLSDRITAGDFIKPRDNDIVVAEGLANILRADVGDSLVLLGQGFQGITAAGIYRIKGIIHLNIPEMNSTTIYMSLDAAQWFYGADDRVTCLIVMPKNAGHTHRLAGRLREGIDSEWYRVLTWDEMLADLLVLMQFDIAGTMVLLLILYIVIAFGLFGTMLTMLLERRKEFAMLMSLGMKRYQLAAICFTESIFLSLTGALAGIITALPVILYLHYFPIELGGNLAIAMEDYGFEAILPIAADPSIFLSQALIVLMIAMVIGLYPVYSVHRLDIMSAKQ